MQTHRRNSVLLAVALLVASAGSAADTATVPILITDGWTPTQAQVGVDTQLYMTIDNQGADDVLVRASCPVANFVELRVLDQGEGAPALRAVKRIPVPAGGALKLAPLGARIALLQTTQVLAPGQHFSCRITFQNAGPIEAEFRVGDSASNPPN